MASARFVTATRTRPAVMANVMTLELRSVVEKLLLHTYVTSTRPVATAPAATQRLNVVWMVCANRNVFQKEENYANIHFQEEPRVPLTISTIPPVCLAGDRAVKI
jgi:hypothetical protein